MLDQPIARPKTWLAESILVTIFCCLPFGIVGIVHAAKVDSAFNAGNYEEADNASREAKKWLMIGFWIGIVAIGLYLLFIVAMMLFAAKNGGLEGLEGLD